MDPNDSIISKRANNFSPSLNGMGFVAIHNGPVPLHIHRLLPLAVLYFFFNTAGLPLGLSYASILSPLFFLWLYKEGQRWVTLKFLVFLLPFIFMHIRHGLGSPSYYARSMILLWCVYVTVYAFCLALLKDKNIERLFDELIVLNFCAAMGAIVILFTPYRELLWSTLYSALGGDGGWAPRLMLLTLEPSVYGQLMAPLLIFSVLRLLRRPGTRTFIYAGMIAIPVLLSQSFGALSICTAALGVVLFPRLGRLLRRPSSLLILGLGVLLLAGVLFVPNPIARRVDQIAGGTDSSIHSRTINAYILAFAIAEPKSLWWGVGPGQAKLFDDSRVLQGLGFATSVLPDNIADTFAALGIIGVLVKLVIEVYLFFRSRVYSRTFGLAMFVVSFLYQFTGGYLTNAQEYLIWCFAFAPFFPWLNLQSSAQAHVNPEVI